MPLKKCEYCRYRGRASQMPRHLRHCLPARRARKKLIPIAELVNPEDIILTPGTKSVKLKDNNIPAKKGRKKKNEAN